MIVSSVVLFLGQAEIERPVPAFWPFGADETTGFTARYFALPAPPPSLADVDFGADPDATAEIAQLSWPDGLAPFWEGGPADSFAAHFSATLVVEQAGEYSFHLTSDDGSALLLGGARIIDNDGTHPMLEASATVALEAGAHEVEILYMEQTGSQGLTLHWTGPDTGGARIAVGLPADAADVAAAPAAAAAAAAPAEPAPDLSWVETLPGAATPGGCGFAARYFALPDLPWLLADVDFAAPPADTATLPNLAWPLGDAPFWEGGPADGFAAHFATTLDVETPGTYSFQLVSDDGSALLVDGEPVVVNDGSHPATERVATLDLAAGTHALDVVYFERDGEQLLTLDWSGPDTAGQRQPVAPRAADCLSTEAAATAPQ